MPIALGLVGIGLTAYTILTAPSESAKAPATPTERFSAEQRRDLIGRFERATKTGTVRADCGLSQVWVDSLLWRAADYQAKELIGLEAALYCAEKKHTNTLRVDLVDAASGKKLGTYSGAWGFSVE